jgi:hypothetical protein
MIGKTKSESDQIGMGSPKKGQSLVTHADDMRPITTGDAVLAKSP